MYFLLIISEPIYYQDVTTNMVCLVCLLEAIFFQKMIKLVKYDFEVFIPWQNY